MYCVCSVFFDGVETKIIYRIRENGGWDMMSDRVVTVPGNQTAQYPLGKTLAAA